MSMVEFSAVAKNFGATQVLHDINLKIEAGEVVVIIGPSGSGKSTLLRCINKLEAISSGTLLVAGMHITDPHANECDIRREAGMVFQQFHLFPHLTALENVMFGPLRVRKQSKAAAREQALALLDRVGLRERANHYPAELSGGQQQRVAIARALAMDPTLLLLDEPTSALDPEIAAEVVDVIKDLASEGRSMLVASHDLRLVQDISDKVVFMVGGRIVEEGPADEVLGQPKHERTRQFLTTLGRGHA